MRKLDLPGLTALALVAFAAFTAQVALAEEPAILVLEGKASELKGTFTAKNFQGIQLSGANTVTAAEAKLLLNEVGKAECQNMEAREKDTNLCNDVPLHLTGAKQGEVGCRSENAKGEKDPVETVLSLLDLHVATEETSAKALELLLFAKVLGTALEEEVKLNCGLLKYQLKGVTEGGKEKAGVITCLLLPGLKNVAAGEHLEILCKVNATTHDPETGVCAVLCTDFGTVGLQANLNGKTFEDSWWSVHFEGSLNKDVFIED